MTLSRYVPRSWHAPRTVRDRIRLGGGRHGEVYRARDTRLARTVAIKVLPDTLAAEPQFHERFEREARALAALSHPHICQVFDVGRERELDFLVLEHLEGETLAARLEQGALRVQEALQVGIQIVDALAAAHRAGIVHRDLKPGNIMLAKSSGGRQGSPQAKLLDFGLAKPAASAVAGTTLSMLPTTPAGKASLTEQGTILGTFQYMAPEQLEGKDADARTDIFAFGAVLYEMLTGRKAFEGKSHASLIGAIMHTLQDPTAMSPDGSRIVFNQTGATTGGDVMQLQLPLGGSTQRRPVGADGVMPLVQTPFTERNGDISPDGRWLAYEANDSGQF